MLSTDGMGTKKITTIDAGKWPNTIPDMARYLFFSYLTIAFHVACKNAEKITMIKTKKVNLFYDFC